MASKQSTVDFIAAQAANAGTIVAKKMFGEYGVYCDGKIVALVCDDQLFVKPTQPGIEFIGAYEEALPYPTAKPWLLISNEQWNDSAWLSQLLKITAAHLPLPKKKTKARKHAGSPLHSRR